MTRDDAEAMLLDVAPHVHAAMTAFEPPEGYTAYPMPTKNNAQRSLIYSFGCRVQSLQDGKSLWFCLASAQCRANRTTISTVANISGCTRHLQVFHGIVSPKTLTMTKKALVSMETGALKSSETDSSGQPHRARVLDAVRTIVVRNLLPLRAVSVMLDGSPQVDSRVEEADVTQSLLEMFGATQKTIADGIHRELAIAMAPLLHLSLTKSTSSSGDALVLRARFLTEGFEVKDVGLGVKRMEGANDSMMVVHWIERVLDAYRIKWLNDVATVTVDGELPHASNLEVALSVHFQRSCALTCADLCLSVLACTMGVRDSPMRRLVEAVLAFARFAVSVGSLEEVFEEVAQDILALVRCDSTGRRPWCSIFAVMERAAVAWDEIHRAISTGPTPSCPPVLLTEFTQPELLEAISILHPIQRLLSPSARVDEDTSNETRTTMEALIAMYALPRSTLNVTAVLHLLKHGDDGWTNDFLDVSQQRVPADLTASARDLRAQVSLAWTEMLVTRAVSTAFPLVAAFFHPCFRRLEFLQPQDKSVATRKVMTTIAQLHQTIKSRKVEAARGLHDTEVGESDEIRDLKRRRLAREDHLRQQATELSRLGFIQEILPAHEHLSAPLVDELDTTLLHLPQQETSVLNRELNRYLEIEAVAFCDVPYDQVLQYWQRKSFEYPALTRIAQICLGFPSSALSRSTLVTETSTRDNDRMLVWPRHRRRAGLIDKMTLFLHLNESSIPDSIASMSCTQSLEEWVADASAKAVLGEWDGSQHTALGSVQNATRVYLAVNDH